MRKILVIDPSIRQCGWAVYTLIDNGGAAVLTAYGCIRGQRIKGTELEEWQERAFGTAIKVRELKEKYKADTLVIEEPEQWGSSARSAIASASNSLEKLCTFTGMIMGHCFFELMNIHTLKAKSWKGNMNKTMTTKKINLYFGLKLNPKTYDNNTADAIGIGLSFLRSKKIDVKRWRR